MKSIKFILSLLLLFNSYNLILAQSDNKIPYKFQPPYYFGREEAFLKYVSEQLHLKNNQFKGTVKGQCVFIFKLSKDNSIKSLTCKDSTNNKDFNRQALNIISSSSSKWVTAKLNNHPIDALLMATVGIQENQISEKFIDVYSSYSYFIDKILEDNYYNEGVAIQANGDFSESMKFYNEAIKINANDFDAIYNRGICFLKTGDTLKACEDWTAIKNAGSNISQKALLKYCSPANAALQENNYDKPQIFTLVQQMPEFPGGESAMLKFIANFTKYPIVERKKGKEGTVFLTFVVTSEGKLNDIRVLREVPDCPGFSEEAIRVVSTMPDWVPGKQDGKNVNVQFQLPIRFTLR